MQERLRKEKRRRLTQLESHNKSNRRRQGKPGKDGRKKNINAGEGACQKL